MKALVIVECYKCEAPVVASNQSHSEEEICPKCLYETLTKNYVASLKYWKKQFKNKAKTKKNKKDKKPEYKLGEPIDLEEVLGTKLELAPPVIDWTKRPTYTTDEVTGVIHVAFSTNDTVELELEDCRE